ncbi:MAG: PQQ-like beta-propeller repeat protein [Verrucomicrobia bacterium]|nr:PQQ-like beta-propeller repeat protein [Verrucomicrobiota bacterium]
MKKVRFASYLFPPLGLLYLWNSPELRLRKKIFGTLGVLLYSIIYLAAVIFLLTLFTPLGIEWRGGFPPVLTFTKTLPNFDAVEAHRAKLANEESALRSARSEESSYWNGFRGPNRDGVYTEQPVSTNWPAAGFTPIWKQPCGSGYASFAIAEGLAFTIEQRREKEVVAAYDIETGAEVWAHSYDARFDESMGGEGPRATPAYDSGKVYSLGAMGDLICFEADNGNLLWQKNILRENAGELLYYGTAGSPLIVGNLLIVAPGGPVGKSVVAYDKSSGERIWTSLNDSAAYSSPMLVELAGEQQLIVVTETRAVGLTVADGKLLWEIPWKVNAGNRNIAQPLLLGTNRFMLSAGYATGCMAVEITKAGEQFSARELWRNRNLKNKFSSSVLHEGFIYGLDEDILVCLDAQTGLRKWKDGRYGYGQLVLASDHLVILTGDGQLALVQASPESHQELIRFPAIQGKTWNHPAISAGKLFVRNMVEMACYDITVK